MISSLYECMSKALIQGGFEALTEAAYRCLKYPVMVTDAQYYCLAHFPDKKIGDPLWDAIHQEGNATIPFVQLFNDEGMIQDGIRRREPYFINDGYFTEYPRIIGNIFVEDGIVGYLAILCPEASEELLEAASFICSMLSVEFQRRSVRFGSIPDAWSMFLNNLFEGRIRDPAQLEQWSLRLDRTPVGDFCVAAAQPEKGHQERHLLPFIQRSILQLAPDLCPVVYEETLYFLIMNCRNQEDCRKKLKQLMYVLESFHLRFGASNRFSDIMQIEIYRDQASFALQVCLENKQKKMLDYQALTLQKICRDVLSNIPLQSCVHPAIDQLEQYDKQHGTEYEATLSAYILSMCNASETVATLHIHRNTLPHRLEAIQRMTELHLSDPEVCAHLLFSFYLLKEQKNRETTN